MQYVALLRGVNVGGGNKVPMAALRKLAEGLGWGNVRSYLASGNLVFEADGGTQDLASDLRGAMAAGLGVDVPVCVLTAEALRDSLTRCPFVPDDPRQVHVGYLFGPGTLDQALFDTHRADGDGLVVDEKLAWLYTPGGFGRSKLASRFDRLVGRDMTARNLRTVRALCEMLDAG